MKNLFFDNVPLVGLILGILFGLALYYAGATNRVVISKCSFKYNSFRSF